MLDIIRQVLTIANMVIGGLFFLCYFYQLVFLVLAYLKKNKKMPDAEPHKIAVLIAARNEEKVITNLLDTLWHQDYPREFFDVFLVADNCTDNTAEVARAAGAIVYERHNTELIGKGYVLDLVIKNIWRDFGEDAYDAFLVFDADNLVDKNYLTEINKTFSQGYDVVSSYRNATNYGDGWRAAGTGMWFLRDARVLNNARMKVGSNTFVAGTGFLMSNKLAKSQGGWPYHTLTEDFEFTVNNAFRGIKTGYCETARFYDWQSSEMRQSWRQKLRWTKGGFQVMKKYRRELLRGLFSRKIFSCFDMSVCMFGAFFVSMLAIAVNVIGYTALLCFGAGLLDILIQLALLIPGAIFALCLFSFSITVSEWKRLKASTFKKILYIFTFPIYIFSYIPVAFAALFAKKVEWKPIRHDDAATRNVIEDEESEK